MLAATAPIVVHVKSGADAWTVLAGVSALLAATGALAGLVYVRRTVTVAQATLKETRVAHDEEMDERRRAFEMELSLRRIDQTQRVLEATIELRELAFLVDSGRDPAANTERLPAVGAKLAASLAGLSALRGPALDELARLAGEVELRTRAPIQIVGETYKAIKQIRELFASDPTLRLSGDPPPPRP